MQKYHDDMAILRKRGKLNVFITMTAKQDIQATKMCRTIRLAKRLMCPRLINFNLTIIVYNIICRS